MRADDSEDSLLVDELDQGAGAPWLRASRVSSHPWLPPGFETHGSTNWGVAATGWAQPGSHYGSTAPGIYHCFYNYLKSAEYYSNRHKSDHDVQTPFCLCDGWNAYSKLGNEWRLLFSQLNAGVALDPLE